MWSGEGAQIVFTNKTPSATLRWRGARMRYIGVLATGYIVDVDAARRGIVVTNIPTYGTARWHRWSLRLEMCHHVQARRGQSGDGPRADFCFWDYPLIELAERRWALSDSGASNGRHRAGFRMNAGIRRESDRPVGARGFPLGGV